MERQRNIQSGAVKFINELIEIKYNKKLKPVVAKSSIKWINIDVIKSIDGVCKKWDKYTTVQGIMIITDYMAKYIHKHKLIAYYIYDGGDWGWCEREDRVKEEPCDPEDHGPFYTTYLSYNPKYTRERLIKLRKNVDIMPSETLDKEKLIKFTEAWD